MQLPSDPLILELFLEFVDSWLDDIEAQFTPLFDARDQKELYRMAHTLKGSGFQFGIDDLGNAGLKLMSIINEEKWSEIKEYKSILLNILQDAKDTYNATYQQ